MSRGKNTVCTIPKAHSQDKQGTVPPYIPQKMVQKRKVCDDGVRYGCDGEHRERRQIKQGRKGRREVGRETRCIKLL